MDTEYIKSDSYWLCQKRLLRQRSHEYTTELVTEIVPDQQYPITAI